VQINHSQTPQQMSLLLDQYISLPTLLAQLPQGNCQLDNYSCIRGLLIVMKRL
jgi:hypothetical protein